MPSMATSFEGGTTCNTSPMSICARDAILRLEFHCSNKSINFPNLSLLSEIIQPFKSALASDPSWSSASSASASRATLRLMTSIAWSVRICLICPGRSRSNASVRASSIFPSCIKRPIFESFITASAFASWRAFARSEVTSLQTQSLESEPPETIRSPRRSMHHTFPTCSSKVAAQSAVRICQSFKRPSTPLVMSCMPPDRKHTRSTALPCP
mmetsp:Transcript_99630/g.281177  ORF Transcript_99630/g.281177 Transcript_99630/m.281177 type:complete len:212 (+) Transcript_99630:519-1154(+)